MPLTKEEFEEMCRECCPQCAAGYEPRYRADTREWVHDTGAKGQIVHSFCLATGIRKMYEIGKWNG